MKDEDMVREYEKNVGHPPRTLYPEDDPDWGYKGTPEEKQRLKERVDPDVEFGVQEELPL